MNHKPIILVMAGHDPTGGAGIQADIEAIHAMGGHALSLITALTTQDTRSVYDFKIVPLQQLRHQAKILLADCTPDAFKLGMLGDPSIVSLAIELLEQYPDVPVVLDPVLSGNLHGSLATPHLIDALLELLPQTTLLTPNIPELTALTADLSESEFFEAGLQFLLLKGAHRQGTIIQNELRSATGIIYRHEAPRLPAEFHGSGCTLASACACLLGQGLSVPEAVTRALDYTQDCLARAFAIGKGQLIPGRKP